MGTLVGMPRTKKCEGARGERRTGDVDQLHEETNEAHDDEANSDGSGGLLELYEREALTNIGEL
jgi:hypothetical protein